MNTCFFQQIARITFILPFMFFLWPIVFSLSAQESYQEWLKLSPEVLGEWKIEPEFDDSLRVHIVPKNLNNEAESKKILVLFPKKSSAYDKELGKILSIFHEKQMNAKFTVINFKGKPYLGKKVLEEVERNPFDLIFSMGSKSTAFLHKNYRNRPIPVVTVCSKDPVLRGQMANYTSGSNTNIAYTSLDMQIEVQIAYLKELKPQLKNIAIIYAQANQSAYDTQVKPMLENADRYHFKVIEVVVKEQSNAKEELSYLIPQSLQIMSQNDPQLKNSIFWITGSTSIFREIETINRYSKNVPVLSVVPDVVSEGSNSAVLSIGVSFESNAHLAAIYGIDILEKKKKPGELKVGLVTPPDIAINFKKAREIQLKVPFRFFETASIIYDHRGKIVRKNGKKVKTP